MTDDELKATMARLEAEEKAGTLCPCLKCTIERAPLYKMTPAIRAKLKKKKRSREEPIIGAI